MAQLIQPAFEELTRQAASGDVLYNDDTSVKILEFLDHDRVVEDPKLPGQTGVFTTGIVSTKEGLKIALFFSGRKHAGETLRMRGYSDAQARQIFRDLIDMPANVTITDREVEVSFHRRAHLPIILDSGLIDRPVSAPWSNGLRLRLTTYNGPTL